MQKIKNLVKKYKTKKNKRDFSYEKKENKNKKIVEEEENIVFIQGSNVGKIGTNIPYILLKGRINIILLSNLTKEEKIEQLTQITNNLDILNLCAAKNFNEPI